MCGILGLYSKNSVAPELIEGLVALQHRGQDSAGVLTSDVTLHLKKGNGTVSRVFSDKNIPRLTGLLGIGHVRYPTIGPGSAEDAQPFYINHPFGIGMVHNGNVTNYFELRRELVERDKRQLTSFSDLEPILNVFGRELERTDLGRFGPDAVFRAVRSVFRQVKGSYSVVGLIHGQGLVAFRDPHGIKPLAFGRRNSEFAFASESVAFDHLGFEEFRDVLPGEVVFIDCRRRVHSRRLAKAESRICIFEYVYFARPDSVIDGIEVYEARLRLGERLAEEVRLSGVEPDVVVPVPDTARAAASSLARSLDVELREGLIKNRYIARTFIMHGQDRRTLSVRQKLNPVRSQVAGKRVLLVDDSIVRGTTSREIVQMVRHAGARAVYLAVTAPPLRFPCVYGIDMMTRGEFIAKRHVVDWIRERVGADALIYQTYDGLLEAVRGSPSIQNPKSKIQNRQFCTACFSGCYPTGLTARDLRRMELERRQWIR